MLYYRYRSGSELSIKELIYDEIYFCSASECNDPFEGKIFATLDLKQNQWEMLLKNALGHQRGLENEVFFKRLVMFFLERSPICIDQIININPEELFIKTDTDIEKNIIFRMYNIVKKYIEIYMPDERYFASFSKSNDNILMWSHYANNHKGYCLVFRIKDNELCQAPFSKRTTVSFSTPNSFARSMSFSIGDSFKFRDIEYTESPDNFDAILCFPPNVGNREINELELDDFRRKVDKLFFQKNIIWKYEQESRISISSGKSWLAGERLRLSPIQRLFHYDSTQLVGIILGAKMSIDQKARIKEIILGKVNQWFSNTYHEKDRIISDFVVFNEVLSRVGQEVKIVPEEIYTGTNKLKNDSEEFLNQFERWKNGWAIHFCGSSGSKIQVK